MATKKKSPARESASHASAERKPTRTTTKTPGKPAVAKAARGPAGEGRDRRPGEPAEPQRRTGRLPTGSLHAQPRVPEGAEELKRKLTEVMNASQRLKKLKGSVPKNFYQIGEILQQVRDHELHQVKGYSSLEDFAEREAGLSPQASSTSLRIFETFLPATAERISFQRLSAAIRAIDETTDTERTKQPARTTRSPIPPHKL